VLGRTAVALSGGLDSRAILCGAERHPGLFAFCAFDEQNAEFRSAKAIADGLGVEFVPFQRPFDYYGDNARWARGSAAAWASSPATTSSAFGKTRAPRRGQCRYRMLFDYLFKSLSLDAQERGLLRREHFSAFSFEKLIYRISPWLGFAPAVARAARSALSRGRPQRHRPGGTGTPRHAPHVPALPRGRQCPTPGAAAGDRLVHARGRPAVLELARTTPPEMKLNRRVYLNAVRRICGEAIARIPDANTGLPLCASALRLGLNRYRGALRRWIERHRRTIATSESWPNWSYYIRASAKLRTLWQRPNPLRAI